MQSLKKSTKLLDYLQNNPLYLKPQQLVNQMTTLSTYPNGKPVWSIASSIVNSKYMSATNKVELLLDMYGRYFKYQFDRHITFDVYEDAYEAFTFKINGVLFKNEALFNQLKSNRQSEMLYLVLRDISTNYAKILQKETKNKNMTVDTEALNLSPDSLRIINQVNKLNNDYFERCHHGIIESSIEENTLLNEIINRYDNKNTLEKLDDPFPEFL